MKFLFKILKSFKFWGAILLLPFLLIGCSSLFVNFDSDFVSDDVVTRHEIQVGDISLSYLKNGDPKGQRVIFVHGTPGDAGGNWQGMLRSVPEGYEYIAIDRPGFGLTKPKKDVVTLDAQAAVLAPLMQTRNGKGTILVGHSLGGPIVAIAAAHYPNKVAGIVIAAGALDPNLEEVLFIQHVGNTPPFSWLLDSTLKNSNRELIALENELRLLEPKLARIKQHVRIIHGTDDELVPYANVAFMEQKMTGTASLSVTRIKGMNHFLQWAAQDELTAAILDISAATKLVSMQEQQPESLPCLLPKPISGQTYFPHQNMTHC